MNVYQLPVTLKDGRVLLIPIKAANKFDAFEQRYSAIGAIAWERIGFPRD
jgi:hypothetical protein